MADATFSQSPALSVREGRRTPNYAPPRAATVHGNDDRGASADQSRDPQPRRVGESRPKESWDPHMTIKTEGGAQKAKVRQQRQ